jgi:hypothetical protein
VETQERCTDRGASQPPRGHTRSDRRHVSCRPAARAFRAGQPRSPSLPGSSGREDRERAVMQRVISDCSSALTQAGRPRVRIPDTGEQGSSRPCQDRRTHRPQCGADRKQAPHGRQQSAAGRGAADGEWLTWGLRAVTPQMVTSDWVVTFSERFRRRWLPGGSGEGDLHTGVEPLDLTDLGAGAALGVCVGVVGGSGVGEAPAAVADELPGDGLCTGSDDGNGHLRHRGVRRLAAADASGQHRGRG